MFPVKVDSNSLIPFLNTLVQRALIAGLAYFGATGYISDSDVVKIASGVVSFGLIVVGAVKSYRKNEVNKVIEPQVSDALMQKKGA